MAWFLAGGALMKSWRGALLLALVSVTNSQCPVKEGAENVGYEQLK